MKTSESKSVSSELYEVSEDLIEVVEDLQKIYGTIFGDTVIKRARILMERLRRESHD